MNRNQLSRLAWALCFTLAAAASPVEAREVFKWKDADGQVHFGDRPQQPDAESLTIRSGPSAADNGKSQERLKEVLEGFAKEREAREATRSAQQEDAEQRERACTFARSRQHTITHANFLYDYTAEGERRVIDGDEYRRALEDARQAVIDSCE